MANAPSDSHVWLLLRREDFEPMWWPQKAMLLGAGNFDGNGTAGIAADSGYIFDIGVVAVNSDQHRALEAYRKDAMRTGDWKPIDISPPLCAATVKVKRQ